MKLLATTVTVAATTEPVTLAEAKRQLRITDSNSDTEINELIAEARALVEDHCNRYWAEQTVRWVYSDFPAEDYPFKLHLPDVSSLTSVTYIDENDAEQTLSTSGLTLDGPRERIRTSTAWPDGHSPAVTMVAGPPTVLPPAVSRAIKMVITDLYEHRGAQMPYQIYENEAVMAALTFHRNDLGI